MDIGNFFPGSNSIIKAIENVEDNFQPQQINNTTINIMAEASNNRHIWGVVEGIILSLIGGISYTFFFRWLDTQSVYDRDLCIIFCVFLILGIVWVLMDIKKTPHI